MTRGVICAALTAIGACTSGAPEGGIPLPPAYPRIAVADSVFTPLPALPVRWEVNEWARETARQYGADGSVRLDLTYEPYRASLLLTFTPADSAERRSGILRNRFERMALNTTGLPTRTARITDPGGTSATILTAPSGSPTPVQFVADAGGWIISGALLLGGAPASADSIAPVVRAVTRDITHALRNLKNLK